MRKLSIAMAAGLALLALSCASKEEAAPRGEAPRKKRPPGPTTQPATAPVPKPDVPDRVTTRPAAPTTQTAAAIARRREMVRMDITRLLVQEVIPAALDRYNMDIGHYPTENEGGLEALLKKPDVEHDVLARKWAGPYLKNMPKDAWGQTLDYEVVEEAEPGSPQYKVWSNGPDRQSGTDDDIRSWREE